MVDDAPKVFEYIVTIASAGMESLIVQDLSFLGWGLDLDLVLKLYEKIPAFRDIKIEVDMNNYKSTQLINATHGQLNIWSGWALLPMIEALDRGIRTFYPSAFHKPFVQVSNVLFR